jgi:poly(A) polymerase
MVKGVEPRTIPRKEHRISRKQVSPNALTTLYRLHRRGFIAYLVGGCVRDLLLGRTPKDFDIGTNATPSQIKRLFRNCRLIGRRFRLAHLHFDNEILEVSTFRRSALPSDMEEPVLEEEKSPDARPRPPRHVKDEDGMVLLDNIFGTPAEDAFRRDFTINALAYNIANFSIIDYTSGLSDLDERLIRPIGDPLVRFTEDPVRMLRAVRFAASHDFVIESAAWESLCDLSPTISRVSSSRLYEEIQKIFLLGSARPAFRLLEMSGLFAALFPGLVHWMYEESSHLALVDRNLGGLDQLYRDASPPSLALFFAALFGPGIQRAALSRHRDGIPRHQALDEGCAAFMQEIQNTVSVPGRVGGRMRAILALQASLTRTQPRRPASLAAKPEFREALAYLRILAETETEHRTSLEWWDAFLLTAPSLTVSGPTDELPPKRRRRRRRKRPLRPDAKPKAQKESEENAQ